VCVDVLIITKRCLSRVEELSVEEQCDLMRTASMVGKTLETFYRRKNGLAPEIELAERGVAKSSLTFVIQDGSLAGQTVRHTHMHVIPRFLGDFQPQDAIYDCVSVLLLFILK
jgi:diadenosine tetraphosphate (Ap4A) HIT family hydrolase